MTDADATVGDARGWMSPPIRRAALVVHVVASAGWVGAVAAFFAMAVVGLRSDDASVFRAMYIGMSVITAYVLVPLSLASLVTGVVQGLGTKWGLLRHYWVVVKLALTAFATLVLLLQLSSVSYLGRAARTAALDPGELRDARASLIVHAGGGAAVLLVAATLSVFKPRGLTRFARRG